MNNNNTTPPESLPGHFPCRFPNCTARYRRKEHLRRHEVQHIQDTRFPCSICGVEFGRNDTLRRHQRAKHNMANVPTLRMRRACDNCRTIKTRCEGKPICSECQSRGIWCSLLEAADKAEGFEDSGSPEPDDPRQSLDSLRPSLQTSKEERYVAVYFSRVHPHWPFVHKGTFRISREDPVLVYEMVALGMWSCGEKGARDAAVELHGRLDGAIGPLKHKRDAFGDPTSSWPIPLYQATLLHIVFSFLSKPRGHLNLGLDLKPSIQRTPTEALLKSVIRSCRTRGMFYYPAILANFQDTAISQYILVSVEEVKRFGIALYRVCKAVHGSAETAGYQGAEDGLLTADELQFPGPGNHGLWDAATQDEWDCALGEMYVDGVFEMREDDWISRHAELLDVLDGG